MRDFLWSGIPPGSGRSVRLAAWSYLGLVVTVWVVMHGLGDRWWGGTVMLFGPRWVLLTPVVGLLPLAARFRTSAVAPLGLAAIVVLFPIMGLETGWRSWWVRLVHDTDFRVITFNTANGGMPPSALPELLEREPDVLALQECGKELGDMITQLRGWHTYRAGGLCLVSAHPFDRVDAMDREHLRQAGGAGHVIRFTLRTPDRLVWFTNLHLDTPRAGLTPISEGELGEGIDALRTKLFTRDIESKQARQWVDAAPSPSRIVVGDFNMPVESVIYGRHWSDLRNAFSAAGAGFGATRDNGWIQARIDHVLTAAGWRARHASVGPSFDSDHRMLMVDLAWVGD